MCLKHIFKISVYTCQKHLFRMQDMVLGAYYRFIDLYMYYTKPIYVLLSKHYL